MQTIRLLAIAAALMLSACAGIPEDSSLDELRTFTAADAKAAKTLAEKAGDVLAVQCYAYLEKRLTPVEGETLEVTGAISAFQLARNARRAVSGDDVALRQACAPLALDSPLISRLLTIRGAAGTILTGGL